jgi:hypothetical protein
VTRENPLGRDGIDDRMRSLRWNIDNYSLNRQIGQPVYTLLGCEAAGMVPQLARVAHPRGVSVLSGGGFDSLTAKHDLAQEIAKATGQCGSCMSATMIRAGFICSALSMRMCAAS